MTRARVAVLTTLALFSTRETVAVETLARWATCSRFMAIPLLYPPTYTFSSISGDSCGGAHAGGALSILNRMAGAAGDLWCGLVGVSTRQVKRLLYALSALSTWLAGRLACPKV